MRTLIFIIITFLASLWVTSHDGILKIEWLNYQIDLNVSFAFLILFALIFILIMIIKVTLSCSTTITRCSYYFKNKNSELKHYKEKLIQLNNYVAIARYTQNSRSTQKFTGTHYNNDELTSLLSWQIFVVTHQYTHSIQCIKTIANSKLLSPQLIYTTIINQISQISNTTKKLDLLQEIVNLLQHKSWVVVLKVELFILTKNWELALSALNSTIKHKLTLPYDVNHRLGVLQYALATSYKNSAQYDKAINLLKNINCNLSYLVVIKAEVYYKNNQYKKAICLLQNQYRINPHKDIAEYYQQIAIDKDSILTYNPEYWFSKYLLIKKQIYLEQFDLALKNLNISIDKCHYISFYYLMVYFKSMIKDTKDDVFAYLDNIQSNAKPDPHWQCNNCHKSVNWNHECNYCQEFGSIIWVN